MNDRQWLERLVMIANQFRDTPIVDDDFPAYRNKFDLALEDTGRYLRKSRPTIVCLCGSTRFKQEFIDANFRETMAGKIVLSVGWFSHTDKHIYEPTEAEKKAFDLLHLKKIDACDEVLILNVGNYIGESTRREIDYAEQQNKVIRYLVPLMWPDDVEDKR